MALITTLTDIQDLENLLNQSPPLTKLNIDDIRHDLDTSNRFLQGRIKFVSELVRHVKLSVQYRKINIEEEETGECLNVVLLVDYMDENFATQLNFIKDTNFKINDSLVVTNFKIEIDPLFPHHDRSNICHAVVNLSSANSRIVVIKSNCSSNPKKKPLCNVSAGSFLSATNIVATKSQKKERYIYTKLSDLASGTTVNVFGVVKFAKEPCETYGADCRTLLSIVDETSINTPGKKLKCVIFGSLQRLPTVKIGQIIRFHRLKITTFNGDLQGGSGPGFSWVIFDGAVDAPLTPVSTLSSNNTLTDEDETAIKKLRIWADSQDASLCLSQEFNSSHKYSGPTLSDIRLDQYFDLVCQVIGKCVVVEGESVLLKVWDGTLVKLKLYQQDISNDLALRFHLDKTLAKQIRSYIVDVFVFDDHFLNATKVQPGDFIKLQNLHTMKHKPRAEEKLTGDLPSAELCLHKGFSYNRSLKILDPTSAEVEQLKKKLAEVLAESDDFTDSLEDLEEIYVEEPVSSTSGKSHEAKIVSDASCNDSEEYFTPSSQNDDSHMLLNDAPYVSSKSFEEDICIDEMVLAESEVHLSANKKLPSKTLSSVDSDFTPKRLKVESSKRLTQDKENGAVVENGALVGCSATVPERVVSTGSQCSMQSSCGFATDRCMLTTATVLTGHHHISVTQVEKILRHAPPYKFRFQGYAINYQPKSETVEGFLRLHCEICKFLSPIPSFNESASLNTSNSSGIQREPILKCVNNKIRVFGCPHCNADLEYVFMLEFMLHDGTGWLCAGLWKNHANNFFGCTPLDLLTNPAMYSEIKEKLNVMCFGIKTVKDVDRKSVLDKSDASKMECCLMSYRTPCGIGYQIFDTMFAAP